MTDVNEPGKPLFAGDRAIDELAIERFEEAWQTQGSPKIGEFLPESDARPGTLIELVHVDLEYRLKFGEVVRVEKYLDEFPQLASDPELAMNLIAAEYELRSRRESDLSVDEFPNRFPHLSNGLEKHLAAVRHQSEFQTASIHSEGEETVIHGLAQSETGDGAISGTKIRDYQLVEKIGEGGMGSVYKAVHERLGRTVAIKVLSETLSKDKQATARFDREMLAVGKLDHPNIVKATDAGDVDGRHFLVMEYVDGVDVASIAGRCQQLPISDACEIVRQAAIGLQHVHENGFVHRDVKPSNLMVSLGPRDAKENVGRAHCVKILDLGLARLIEPAKSTLKKELTATGQLMGTFDYMSPEQTMGGEVDIRADIYSLGSCLYRLLAGRAPYATDDLAAPARKIIALAQREPTPIAELRKGLPEALARILLKMLAKDPTDRFQAPAEVADALSPFCKGADLRGMLEGASPAPTIPLGDEVESRPPEDNKTRSTPSPVRKSGRAPVHRWRNFTIASVMLSLAATVLGVVVIRLQTPEGEWQLSMLEPGQKVTIRQGNKIVKELVVDSKVDVVKLYIGEYEVDVHGANGMKFMDGSLEIHKSGKAIARLEKITNRSLGQKDTVPPIAQLEGTTPLSVYALVTRPAKLDGIDSWTLDTVAPRGTINDVKFNPDGSLLAVASDDGSVRLYKPDGTLHQILVGHDSPVLALAWSTDGELASAGRASRREVGAYQTVIHIWDVAKGRVVKTIHLKAYVNLDGTSLDWHDDRLAVGGLGPDLPCIWDRNDGQIHKITPAQRTGPHNTLAWSRDGQLLAVHGHGIQMEIRDGNTFEPICTLPANKNTHFAWSPTEAKLAATRGIPGDVTSTAILVWDLADAQNPKQVETIQRAHSPGYLSAVAWSPDGKSIAFSKLVRGTRNEQGVVVRGSGVVTRFPNPYSNPVHQIAWRRQTLVAADDDRLQIWNAQNSNVIRRIATNGPTIEHAGLSSDGQILAVDQYRSSIRLLDLRGLTTRDLGQATYPFAWSHKGRRLALLEGAASWKLYKYDSGDPPQRIQDEHCHYLSWAPDDRYLLARNASTTYRVWKMQDGRPVRVRDIHSPLPNAKWYQYDPPSWSAKGEFLAVGVFQKAVVVWETDQWTEHARFETGYMDGLALSPDGSRVVINQRRGFVEFRGPRGELSRLSGPAFRARVRWAADGKHVYGVNTAGDLLVWTAKPFEQIAKFSIPPPSRSSVVEALSQLQFSQDGELLLVAGPGMVSFWQSRTGEPVGTVLSDGTTISPDGNFRSPPSSKSPGFVYVVRMSDESQKTLTPSEMLEYNWKNAPDRALLESVLAADGSPASE